MAHWVIASARADANPSNRPVDATSIISVLVKNDTFNPLSKGRCLGGVNIVLSDLEQMCQNNQSEL